MAAGDEGEPASSSAAQSPRARRQPAVGADRAGGDEGIRVLVENIIFSLSVRPQAAEMPRSGSDRRDAEDRVGGLQLEEAYGTHHGGKWAQLFFSCCRGTLRNQHFSRAAGGRENLPETHSEI